MKHVIMKLLPALAIPCAIVTLHASETDKTAWSYSGQTGPAHWAELSADNKLCSAGKNQSPIDIDPSATIDTALEPVALDYTMMVADRITNNGHTIQVDMRSGGLMKLDGEEFKLKQFHFHTPSENTVKGKNFPLEAHFVHQNEAGELAVAAMLFIPGPPDRTLEVLWENIPEKTGQSVRLSSGALKTIESEIKVENYYRYNGSLTTPPCTEGVRWIVLQQPMTVSQQQLKKLQEVLGHSNNRPVQALNARFIVE